jgi:hypothetical protein
MRVFSLILLFVVAISDRPLVEDFSWQDLLGISPGKLQNELKNFSSCYGFQPFSFRIPVSIPPTPPFVISSWSNFGGNHWVSDDEVKSSIIRVLNCSTDTGVTIYASSFDNIVFEITLHYTRCNYVTCNSMEPTPIDKSLAAKLPAQIVYDGTQLGPTDPNTERYFRVYSSMLSDQYLQNMLFDAGACDTAFVPTSAKYRCIIMATADDRLWHALTMTEVFESKFFSERILGRFASSQKFTLIEVDKRARTAFTAELQAVIENRNRLIQEKDRAKELRENPLKSVR